jgi:DUF218 domain
MKGFGWIRRAKRPVKLFPTIAGLVCLVAILAAPVIWLCLRGESFFSLTRRLPAEVLIVEGWIGKDGIRAAAAEFERGGYQYIAMTGGPTENQQDPSNYSEMVEKELTESGVPKERIIIAPSGPGERQRTFLSAVAAWRALQERGIRSEAINVLTLGNHARRSRLVYAKVYAPDTLVGVIAWAPPDYKAEPWWRFGRRTKCFLKEVVGYPFEVLLNSGRTSNSPG